MTCVGGQLQGLGEADIRPIGRGWAAADSAQRKVALAVAAAQLRLNKRYGQPIGVHASATP